MQGRFSDYLRAVWHVEYLQKFGYWPGIICHKDGSYSLTYEPGRELV